MNCFGQITAIVLACLPLGPAASGQDAEAPDLDAKVAAIVPKPEEERWLATPWEPNLARARAEAQRQGKPILLWIMDGNALGCT